MTYNEDKIRDMIEGILPSAARVNARVDRRNTHRKYRSRNRQRLHTGQFDLVGSDDKLEREEIAEMRAIRRANDKLAGFERWAVKITAHIEDKVERYMYMKSILPDNLIGRHALSHLEFLDEFEKPGYNKFNYGWYGYPRKRSVEAEPNWAEVLTRVVANGDHKKLNAVIKDNFTKCVRSVVVGWDGPKEGWRGRAVRRDVYEHYDKAKKAYVECDCAPRTLKGLHDIEAFVKAHAAKLRSDESHLRKWLDKNEYC